MPKAVVQKQRKWRSDARAAPDVARCFKALGARIRLLRKEKGLTLEALAPLAKLDWKHLQIIESGKTNTTVASLVGIAKALDVAVRDLF